MRRRRGYTESSKRKQLKQQQNSSAVDATSSSSGEQDQQNTKNENNNNKNKVKRNDGNWLTTTYENALLEKFYRDHIIPENEWESFMTSLKTILPSALRISSCCFQEEENNNNNNNSSNSNGNDTKLSRFIQNFITQLKGGLGGGGGDDENVAESCVVRRLPISQYAIDTPVSRARIKRNQENRSGKIAIQSLSENGYVSGQEVVSMVPPWLLDVQPRHRVLDMCAAPGSKTLQLLEKLVISTTSNNSNSNTTTNTNLIDPNSGFVIANDINAGRLDVLQRQANRSPEAASRIIVTNHDARMFPLTFSSQQQENNNNNEIRFDRVLCDAMCSGDGTLRKSADLWDRWRPGNGPALHIQQRGVLFRGMQLCKTGAVIVYSTCSMHPVEDEAVVAACIKQAGLEHFELIDPTTILPNLKYYPGLTKWKVMASDGSWCESYAKDVGPTLLEKNQNQNENNSTENENNENDSAAEKNTNDDDDDDNKNQNQNQNNQKILPQKNVRSKLIPSMFPEFAASSLIPNMHYCCRVLPHLQDTGGFFIAAMRCKKEIPHKNASQNQQNQQQQQKNKNYHHPKQNKQDEGFAPFTEEMISDVSEILKLPSSSSSSSNQQQQRENNNNSFPWNHLFTRKVLSREAKVYFLGGTGPDMIQSMNGTSSSSGKSIGNKVVGVGIRVIESNTKQSWRGARYAMEGCSVVAPFLPENSHIIDLPISILLESWKSQRKKENIPEDTQLNSQIFTVKILLFQVVIMKRMVLNFLMKKEKKKKKPPKIRIIKILFSHPQVLKPIIKLFHIFFHDKL